MVSRWNIWCEGTKIGGRGQIPDPAPSGYGQPNRVIDTRSPEKRTPSFSNRARWVSWIRDPFGKEILPCALITRCHGSPNPSGRLCRAYPTSRACPGSPAAFAIAPYEETRPRGIPATVSQMRSYDPGEDFPATLRVLRAAFLPEVRTAGDREFFMFLLRNPRR
jgi:hypothetical protein